MHMKTVLTGFLTMTAGVIMLFGGENLLRNPGFASKDGHLPDQWGGVTAKETIEAYTTENGVLRISGKTATYACWINQVIEIKPGKNYYFSVDMKSDRLSDHAAIFYSVEGENRKALASARPLLGHYSGAQKDWVRIGYVIPTASLKGAKRLTVSLCVYNQGKKPGKDKAICFRNPELTEHEGQKNLPPPQPHRVVSEGENLLLNPGFASKDGHLPDYWYGYGKAPYSTKNGEVRISGKTATYAAYLGQAVEIEPGKGYYFSVDMKSDRLAHYAAIYYSITGLNRKQLVDSRPLMINYTGPQKDWVRIGFVIPSGSLPNARKLSISLVVYNPSKKPGEDKAIYFRNPELTVYNGQKNLPPPKPATVAASEELPNQPFREQFTGFPLGTPYLLEKGGVGFFRLNSWTMPRREVVLTVNRPAGVEAEVYMWKRSRNTCVKVPARGNRYVIGPEYDWLTWSNCLIFTADESVTKQFKIGMDFECGGKKVSFTVPVQQIPCYTGGKLPEKRRYSSWQAFPVIRIDTANPENKLGIRLKEYWEKAGWTDLTFVEIVDVIPYNWNPKLVDLRQAVDPSGTPVPLYCDSAMIAAGPDFFGQLLSKKAYFVKRLKGGGNISWDYEPYVKGPVTVSCFCPDCIRAFAKAKGLPENLTGMEILAKHRRAWVDFRCRQRADAVRAVVTALKKINPSAAFGFCSMPFAPDKDKEAEYEETYGIRPSLYDDFVDEFRTMNYWSNLDYFRSLEREALELKKPKYTLISNGWGHPNNAPRMAMQYLAAAFCANDADFPGIAQGLYVSNGEQVRELRKVMNTVAVGEKRWKQGRLNRNTRKIREGFNAAGNYYALERKADNGKSWSLLFNNSERETLFLHLDCGSARSVTDLMRGTVYAGKNGNVTMKLPPLTYMLLEFSPEKKPVTAGIPDYGREEELARETYRKKTSSASKYGMSYKATPEKCMISTPVHSLELNLKNSGEGIWRSGKKEIASLVGRDIFMDKGGFPLSNRSIDIEDVAFTQKNVRVRFSYAVKEAPYAGLVVRREYTLSRNTPEIKAYIEIVPEGGYRPFRLRTVNNFTMPRQANPNAPVSEVTAGNIKDRNRHHISFVRQGAKFPNGKPFFNLPKLCPKFYPLQGDVFTVRPVKGKNMIRLSARKVDQLYVWREKGSATLETIWPDAYPDNDPHKVATWKTAYELKLTENR